MRLGLGIDTGGTCTDAVLYDFANECVVAAAKAVTTREDLAVGILEAIDSLPRELLPQVGRVALSTTLATNACVENRGGRAKLLMLNAYRGVVAEAGHRYGLSQMESIRFADMPPDADADDPRWAEWLASHAEWLGDAEALGIVELDADRNGARIEKTAASVLSAHVQLPVIGGHQLFHEPNVMQRGAGTLLNARLMPVINGFLAAVRDALARRGIRAPVVIVRSDGTLMSEAFTGVRPVETLLCGPAASIVGGMRLAGARDCLIVDMGGTTTDLAIVRDGRPHRAHDGVRIGKWRTCVRGVYVETFGLGGDSAIRHTQHGTLHVDGVRVMPLCMAAGRWPRLLDRLALLMSTRQRHTHPLHEGFALAWDADRLASRTHRLTERERRICQALSEGALLLEDMAAAVGTDIYNLDMGRLEQEGIVLRIGLTPTDLMHVRGEFARYDRRASELGLQFVAGCCDMTPEELTHQVYDNIRKKLYMHVVKILLEESDPWYGKHGLGAGLERLIASTWEAAHPPMESLAAGTPVHDLTAWKKAACDDVDARNAARLIRIGLHVPAALVGIGAPTHLFLPEVARALGTECILPVHADVANAVGAIVSEVSAEATVQVRLEGGPGGFAGFRVRGFTEDVLIEDRSEAISAATREAMAEARAEALRRGADGTLTVTAETRPNVARARGGAAIELGFAVTATAVGRPAALT